MTETSMLSNRNKADVVSISNQAMKRNHAMLS